MYVHTLCFHLGFQFFTDYGSLSGEVQGSQQKASFQKLLFLIRDWSNPHKFPFGSDGGRQYIKKILNVGREIFVVNRDRNFP